MVHLIILGTVFISLATAGNSIHLQHNFRSLLCVLLAISSITVCCILFFDVIEVEFFLINTTTRPSNEIAAVATLVLGCILLLFQVKALLYVLISRSIWSIWKKYLSRTSGAVVEWENLKVVPSELPPLKSIGWVKNAISQHDGKILDHDKSSRLKIRSSSKRSVFGQAMLNFQASADYREKVGGVWYTIKKMWNGSLFDEEGVWIHARLYAMNISQWLIALLYLLLVLVLFLGTVIFSLSSSVPTSSPSSAPTSSSSSFAPSVAPTIDFTEVEAQIALGAGAIAALIASVYLALIWIPSSVSTIQQFRCGVIGSLRDKSFQKYRFAAA
jgi:hypothetical protein